VGYLNWLREEVNEKDSLQYWKQYLDGYETIASLSGSTAGKTTVFVPAEFSFTLDTITRNSIRELCNALGITENTFLQTIWGILLAKYNNTDDVVFGTVVSGRPAAVEGIEEMIGLLINTIPVRIKTGGGKGINNLLKEIQVSAADTADHHYTQLADIQAASATGQELFDHILVFENYPVQEMVAQRMQEDESLSLLGSASYEQSNYDLNVIIVPQDDITCRFKYNGHVYTEVFIHQLKDHLLRTIKAVLENPAATAPQLDYMSAGEKHQLLTAFNNTASHYPDHQSIPTLFEEQVTRTPDSTALIFEDKILTYRQLNEKADQIVGYLRTQANAGPGSLIGIRLKRSEQVIIAILGILKCGAAYIPIDPQYPRERVDNILKDSRCSLVIDDALVEQYQKIPFTGEIVTVPVKADDLAYIMYTSGSTGLPKGVMVNHRSVVRLVKNINYVHLDGSEVLLSTGAVSFDATTFEYWSMLLNGGTLVMCREEVLLDPLVLAATIAQHKVNIMWFTAGWLNELVETSIAVFTGLSTILAGGDKLSPPHINKLLDTFPALNIINGYGPTENTTFSLTYKVQHNLTDIPVGRPISNSTAYILGRHLELLPIGVTGEICVGGDGLAAGYLNNEELTAEKFVPHPFKEGALLYRTGDLGRWLPDGNILFAGRTDEQVKVRGYRIELGEIEKALQQHPLIFSAIVLAVKEPGRERILTAYIISEEIIDPAELRGLLSNRLPAYMIPEHYVRLAVFPLNTNGKVDRKKLAELSTGRMEENTICEPPRNEIEEKLVKLWTEILGREKIGIRDNFFEIGGHSLRAARLISNIHHKLNVRLEIKVLFTSPTIEGIAAEIEKIYWADNKLFETQDIEKVSI
jgi:amino acid adenylation domain-containing protein